jgi:transglutaminase-like putative cysteine protease
MPIASNQYLLRFLMAALVLTATMLLGLGERSATLSGVTFAALVASAYLTDSTQRFQLHQGLANALALAVVTISVTNAYYLDRHGLMVAIADLQSYMQYVLLFQPKTTRIYWQLTLLSLGQLAIASTLVPGPTFGIVLLVYLIVALTAFALMLTYSEQSRCAAGWTGIGQPALSGAGGASLSAAAPSGPTSAWKILPQSALVATFTLVVMAMIFFALPRWTVRSRESASTDQLRSVGFSKKVTMGELGEVVNNPDLVMRLQFFSSHGTVPFKLAHDPLLRGTVVARYSSGQWSHTLPASPVSVPTEERTPYVRQRITAEPLDVEELFCVFPIFTLEPQSKLSVDFNCDQLVRREEWRNTRLEFELATTGIVNDTQRQFIPNDYPLSEDEQLTLLQMPTQADAEDDLFTGLRQAAAEVVREKSLDPDEHEAVARALCDYFRSSGRFTYSIEPAKRNPRLDPLEDFMTEHPQGHCEYFAGALVLMLRSQGIPARMAIGFKGGEWNSLGGYYQVQQLHAHSWVEVYLGKRQIPKSAFDSDGLQPDAAWMTLDPTEGAQENSAAGRTGGLFARTRQFLDYANVLWINYVAGLNSRRQRQTVYEPLTQGVNAAVDNLVSLKVWQARWSRVVNSPVGTFWQWYRLHWFSWRGGLVAAGFSLCIGATYWLYRKIVSWWRYGYLPRTPSEEPRGLEIYRRLESALAGRGLTRQPAQTAYEFAVSAGGQMAETVELRRVAHLPRRVVESFYRVRFGGRTLDDQEVHAVEHALVELELVLAASR